MCVQCSSASCIDNNVLCLLYIIDSTSLCDTDLFDIIVSVVRQQQFSHYLSFLYLVLSHLLILDKKAN